MTRRARWGAAGFAVFALAGCLRGSGEFTPNNDRRDAQGNLDAGDNRGTNNGGPDDGGAGTSDAAASDADMPGLPDAGSDMNDPDLVVFVPGVCGNGTIEFGETCDVCALDCDDGNACTVDEPGGDPAACTGFCWNRPLFDCIDADGCCAAGCTSLNDSDCSTTCGDGVIDAGETCDPVDLCPATCDDADPSTLDLMTGSAANCNVVCTHVPVLRCLGGDAYCPPGCSQALDPDCESLCGNGFTEPGETCDPPGSCPTACDDGNSCTDDVMTGNPASCNVECAHPRITACADGDDCCADGCAASQDDDCSATCGDRTIQGDETCDGPPQCNSISCDQGGACTAPIRTGGHQDCNVQCGYAGIINCVNADDCCPEGCTAATDDDCGASCGNAVIEPGEFCDPPELCATSCLDDGDVCTTTQFLGDPAACDARCAYPAITVCGDPEGCCPAGCNATNDIDCDPFCGNNVVETGELCDGNCGTCDDLDACTVDVDTGTAATCDLVCEHLEVTQCVNADGCCAPGCNALNDSDCAPVCDNGVVEPPETCDQNCPASCDDQVACTTDSQSGSAATCDLSCDHTIITICAGGDGCCPTNCTFFNDFDCP